MTTKTNLELQNQANEICKKYGILQDTKNYKSVQLESVYNALYKALNDKLFIRVKKQLTNCINTIRYAVENELINYNDYIIIDYTKNFINRGTLISEVLKKYQEYFLIQGVKMNIHLVDNNNACSVKKNTTRENSITVCNTGIYLTKTSDFVYHYDYTTDKNKKLVKKLTELTNTNNCIVEW